MYLHHSLLFAYSMLFYVQIKYLKLKLIWHFYPDFMSNLKVLNLFAKKFLLGAKLIGKAKEKLRDTTGVKG